MIEKPCCIIASAMSLARVRIRIFVEARPGVLGGKEFYILLRDVVCTGEIVQGRLLVGYTRSRLGYGMPYQSYETLE